MMLGRAGQMARRGGLKRAGGACPVMKPGPGMKYAVDRSIWSIAAGAASAKATAAEQPALWQLELAEDDGPAQQCPIIRTASGRTGRKACRTSVLAAAAFACDWAAA